MLRRWLDRHDVEYELVGTRDWVVAKAPLSTIEKLFNVTYNVCYHDQAKIYSSCALGEMTIPKKLAAHVDLVTGVIGVPSVYEKKERSPLEAPTGQEVCAMFCFSQPKFG